MSNHFCGHKNSKHYDRDNSSYICYNCTIDMYEKRSTHNDIITIMYGCPKFTQGTDKQLAYGHYCRSERLANITDAKLLNIIVNISDPVFLIETRGLTIEDFIKKLEPTYDGDNSSDADARYQQKNKFGNI